MHHGDIAVAAGRNVDQLLRRVPAQSVDPIAVGDIQRIIAYLKRRGLGILITDHNVRETLRITDRAYIIREGEVFRAGTPRALATDPEVRRVYLGDDFDLLLPETVA